MERERERDRKRVIEIDIDKYVYKVHKSGIKAFFFLNEFT